MKSWVFLVLITGCTAGGDTANGSRALCAEGGASTACAESARTPQGACWRLVDCGAISISSADPANHFDWGDCVDTIESRSSVGQQLVIDCIAASSCDGLKVPGSPENPDTGQMACLHFGGNIP